MGFLERADQIYYSPAESGGPTISLSRQDWSLHRKGPADQERHNQKVKEAIKGDLQHIISDEAIITSDGKKIVKVPIRGLDLPRFRFNTGGNQGIGQGEGKDGNGQGQQGPGKGRQAGDQPGIDYYEAEITIDELAEMLFEDFQLPNLQPKTSEKLTEETYRFNEISKKGLMPNLDKKRTIIQNLRRNAMGGERHPTFHGVRDDDMRYRIWTPDIQKHTNAVIIAMRDVSGSMGEFEKYITRTFYFWMERFLRTKYKEVDIRFLTHHTEAREVDEEKFFKLGESGGTKVSSAYQLALDIMKKDYDPSAWNVYPFHFSDGDNWGDVDNRKCVELVTQILERSNLFGYGEIREGAIRSSSTLMNAFQSITDNRFTPVLITDKKDVYLALKKFFSARPDLEGAVDRR